MARRRMFSQAIIDSDAFLDMPATSQLLYFHLSMRADDDGFIHKPNSVMRACGGRNDDMNLLIAKKFIIPFESGIVVIKHWRIHNLIAKDRYTETNYKEEKALLQLDEKNAYTLCIQNANKMETQVREGKVSQGKISIDKNRVVAVDAETGEVIHNPVENSQVDRYGTHSLVILTEGQVSEILDEIGISNFDIYVEKLDAFIYKKKANITDHKEMILKWYEEDNE